MRLINDVLMPLDSGEATAVIMSMADWQDLLLRQDDIHAREYGTELELDKPKWLNGVYVVFTRSGDTIICKKADPDTGAHESRRMMPKWIKTPNGTEFSVGGPYKNDPFVVVPGLLSKVTEEEFCGLIERGCLIPIRYDQIALHEWQPKAGDIVQWPNGDRYEVRDGLGVPLEIRCPDGVIRTVYALNPIIHAACCTIWRKA